MEVAITPEKWKILMELVRLKNELVLIDYWKVVAPWLNHGREEEILKRMKDLVEKII